MSINPYNRYLTIQAAQRHSKLPCADLWQARLPQIPSIPIFAVNREGPRATGGQEEYFCETPRGLYHVAQENSGQIRCVIYRCIQGALDPVIWQPDSELPQEKAEALMKALREHAQEKAKTRLDLPNIEGLANRLLTKAVTLGGFSIGGMELSSQLLTVF